MVESLIIQPHFLIFKFPNHIFVAASGWISRIVMSITQLVSIPLLTKSLDLERFAAFALLTSLQSWFLLSDLGFGNSLQNSISEKRANKTSDAAITQIGRYFALVLLFGTLVVVYILSPFASPFLLKPFPSLSTAIQTKVFFLTAVCCAGAGIGSIAYKIWYAEGRGYLSHIVPMVASLLGMAGILFAQSIPEQYRLEYCLAVFLFPPAMLPLTALFLTLLHNRNVSMRHQDYAQFKVILKRAMSFWWFGLMASCTINVDTLIASQILSYGELATYLILLKIFNLAFFAYSAFLLAVWPLCSEAIVNQEWLIVHQRLKKYISIGCLYIVLCTGIILVTSEPMSRVLTQSKNVNFPQSLIALMGVYFMIRVWTDSFAMVLQSASHLKPLLMSVPVQAGVSVSLQWVLAKHLGMQGLIAGTLLSFLLTVSWLLPTSVSRLAAHKPEKGQPC